MDFDTEAQGSSDKGTLPYTFMKVLKARLMR
jgi:hypothetical protein